MARAALAARDSTAQRPPKLPLLRHPTLRKEAQSTSALEVTYAPLADALTVDGEEQGSPDMHEILNYVHPTNHAFARIGDGRPLPRALPSDLQGMLMAGTPRASVSGHLRDEQIMIGRRPESAACQENARFVSTTPGQGLDAAVQQLVDWMRTDHDAEIAVAICAPMTHHPFETLRPFRDGKVARTSPRRAAPVRTRRAERTHAHRLAVVRSAWIGVLPRTAGGSTDGNWEGFIRSFATGLAWVWPT